MSNWYVRDSFGAYTFSRHATGDEIIALAAKILSRRFRKGEALGSPGDTARYLQGKLSGQEREVFCCLFLDTRNRIIAFDKRDEASEFLRENTLPGDCLLFKGSRGSGMEMVLQKLIHPEAIK